MRENVENKDMLYGFKGKLEAFRPPHRLRVSRHVVSTSNLSRAAGLALMN